ncbi:MAG TPA: sulfatase [Planctomycetota bacterium]|nr:sulfatase [Planctomycetota bacterium]
MGIFGFIIFSVAMASGLVGFLRALQAWHEGAWASYGDGVLFWESWAADFGTTRLIQAVVLAVVLFLVTKRVQKLVRKPHQLLVFLGRPIPVALGLAFALLPQGVAPTLRQDASDKPSIILIMLDTVRADEVGWVRRATGRALLPEIEDPTPHLDSLAAQGASFSNAVSQAPWTKPSTATLLSGVVPGKHLAVERNGPCTNFRANQRTLPEALGAAGWETIGISSNPNIRTFFGFHQGFQTFREGVNFTADDALAMADDFLGPPSKRAQPYFLYLHLNDAHFPFEAKAPWGGMYDDTSSTAILDGNTEREYRESRRDFSEEDFRHFRLTHAEEIRYLDDVVGPWLEKQLAQQENLLVVVLSDHGEEFHDHGDVGHGHTLNDELLRVPLQLMWSQDIGLEPISVSTQVRSMDVLPTLLDFCGLSWPSAALALDGESLLPLLKGQGESRPAPSETDSPGSPRSGITGPLRSYRYDGWKWIQSANEGDYPGRVWLYHLQGDPGEITNLALQETGRADSLKKAQAESGWLHNSLEPCACEGCGVLEVHEGNLSADLAALGYGEEATGEGGHFLPGSVPWADISLNSQD